MSEILFYTIMIAVPSACALAIYQTADNMLAETIQKYKDDMNIAEQKIAILERQNEDLCNANDEWYQKAENSAKDHDALKVTILEMRNLFVLVASILGALLMACVGSIYLAILAKKF